MIFQNWSKVAVVCTQHLARPHILHCSSKNYFLSGCTAPHALGKSLIFNYLIFLLLCSYMLERGEVFFSLVTSGKFALYNSFQWRSLKEGMTLDILISVGPSLLKKEINHKKKPVNHRFFFAIFRILLFHEKISATTFLADLSSSRSLVVCPSVCPSVRPSVHPSVRPSGLNCEKVTFRVSKDY